MMQPALYDITYYEGDSLTITIIPRDSKQNILPLTDVANDDTYFRLASSRGDNPTWQARGLSTLLHNMGPLQRDTYIQCDLTPQLGEMLNNGYVYDIGYWQGTNNQYRVTLVTGAFKLMAEVKP
jgi:acid stress-induced BolA-like protein IbaG/YrbA